MSQRGRLGVIAAAVVVAVVGLVIATSSGGGGKTTTGTTHIVVKGGKPVGGVKDITVKKGDRVRFTVRSDVADEVHVHGYDFHKGVRKGGTVSFDFPAKDDGSFEVELEKRAEQIAALKVEP